MPSYTTLLALLALMTPATIWFIWTIMERLILPALIPYRDITAMAEAMIATHGPSAAEIAHHYEFNAWRLGKGVEQGKWRRVRNMIGRCRVLGESMSQHIPNDP